MKAKMIAVLAVVSFATLSSQRAAAQSERGQPSLAPTAPTAATGDTPERLKILRAAAQAMGMIRWSDIGAGSTLLPGVDVINTMEFWGSGTSYSAGRQFKTDYHAALAYNPPAMRVEMTRTDSGLTSAAAPQHTIQVVSTTYAWDESEIGGGLVAGKGTAAPAMKALKARLLQLWILPFGLVKAGLAAGDKTKVSNENGSTVINFPLDGELAGVAVKATLDAKNFVTKVETHTDNPALSELEMEAEYSDYADHGEIPTDVKSPGHIVQKQAGRTVLDIRMKTVDANNPYLVFPVPPSVKSASGRESSSSK